jgi:hypothetical protein
MKPVKVIATLEHDLAGLSHQAEASRISHCYPEIHAWERS